MNRSLVPERAATRLAAFAIVLLVAFGAAFGVGRALDDGPASPPPHHGPTTTAPGPHDMGEMGS